MGWIAEKFKTRQSGEGEGPAAETANKSGDQRKWQQLREGLEHDVAEFQRLAGSGAVERASDLQVRIVNRNTTLTAILTADFAARTIRYDYQSEKSRSAAPEGGVLTLRNSGRGDVDLYSSDQRLDLEQARRLILEPLLFPPTAEELPATGT